MGSFNPDNSLRSSFGHNDEDLTSYELEDLLNAKFDSSTTATEGDGIDSKLIWDEISDSESIGSFHYFGGDFYGSDDEVSELDIEDRSSISDWEKISFVFLFVI